MRIDPDGFKRPEGNDSVNEGILATYENTVLLNKQIKELREVFELLLQKLESINYSFDYPFDLSGLPKKGKWE